MADRIGRLCGTKQAFGLLLLLPLAGCFSTTGDFGRPEPGVFQSIVPVGPENSRFALTEDEKELRARAWRFLNPEQDLGPTRSPALSLVPFVTLLAAGEDGPVSAFHAQLMAEDFRSLVSRYQRLRQVIEADHALIYPFRLTAVHVRQADLVRLQALDHAGRVAPQRADEALARICDNAAIIARVQARLVLRSAQYRYALENLVIEGPEREAIGAERSLAALEADLAHLRRLPPGGPHCGPASIETAGFAAPSAAGAVRGK